MYVVIGRATPYDVCRRVSDEECSNDKGNTNSFLDKEGYDLLRWLVNFVYFNSPLLKGYSLISKKLGVKVDFNVNASLRSFIRNDFHGEKISVKLSGDGVTDCDVVFNLKKNDAGSNELCHLLAMYDYQGEQLFYEWHQIERKDFGERCFDIYIADGKVLGNSGQKALNSEYRYCRGDYEVRYNTKEYGLASPFFTKECNVRDAMDWFDPNRALDELYCQIFKGSKYIAFQFDLLKNGKQVGGIHRKQKKGGKIITEVWAPNDLTKPELGVAFVTNDGSYEANVPISFPTMGCQMTDGSLCLTDCLKLKGQINGGDPTICLEQHDKLLEGVTDPLFKSYVEEAVINGCIAVENAWSIMQRLLYEKGYPREKK